ncbi:sensor for nitrate reductase system, protein histidine kinase (acts on NarP and NarL) [Erwinia amylovora LA635]|nr:sensor for nitrate reductase system, protein histidine kinase (acts on NarP and NarL) [Erwinia amylovora LA635]CDK19281.1 sensor for nitrate reductase system, protein histidine kinase (acts on NarP and NarL) [Erwinia amylovora LA636]CDK22652.1 sensor for nitrate reductase system, protein histidine kinase (acts on NarP and NarL) [Erwinia amylovora LA637]
MTRKYANVRQANRRLRLLFACSELLCHSAQNQLAFQQTLALVVSEEKLVWLELSAPEFGVLSAGNKAGQTRWHSLLLRQPSRPPVGKLRWQGARSQLPLIKSVCAMLANALQRWRNQQQTDALLIQQERAAIAGELHDSLAQELTFQRIQLVRLRHLIDPDYTAALNIVAGIEQSLTGAGRQLRELLNNFRLTALPASLALALEQVIAPLHQHSSARITLACQFSGQLGAQQQTYVVQIVREALVNAVRHASATEISVNARPLPEGGIVIAEKDNGIGIASLEEPDGHHGLNIMNERAACLNGTLLIERRAAGGTCVSLNFTAMTEVI